MKIIEKLFSCDNWNIALARRKNTSNILDYDFEWFPVSSAEFVADPFIIEYQKHIYVFFEKLYLLKSRGELWCSVFNLNGEFIESSKLTGFDDLGCHLSFPFIFKYRNDFYCIPETNERDELILYKSKSFPFIWTKEKTLIVGHSIVDTVFVEHDDSYWLIGSDLDNNRQFFKSEGGLFDDWHQVDPCCSYASNHQRMAGKPIIRNNDLYFITQECGKGFYGNSLILSKVDILSESSYIETFIEQIYPFDEQYNSGIHTLNYSENFVVIDSKKRKYSLIMPLIKLIYSLKCKYRLKMLKGNRK